jgi:hypothetical protein
MIRMSRIVVKLVNLSTVAVRVNVQHASISIVARVARRCNGQRVGSVRLPFGIHRLSPVDGPTPQVR